MPEFITTLCGIVLPALLITWLVRRWITPVRWRIAFGLLLLVVVVLIRPIFSRDMPVVLAEVMRGYPYRGVFETVKSINPDTNDTVKQILPWMQVAREELFAFRAPLFNRYAFSGYPLLGNGSSAPFSPFFLLTLFVALPKQLVAMAGLKIFTGLLFTWLFLKDEGASNWAAAFGAGVFALSVFQNVYLHYPLTSVTFVLPVLAFGVMRCVRESSLRSAVLVAIATAAALLGGHPESVIHCALGAMLLLVIEFWSKRRIDFHGFAAAVLGAIVGAILSLPGWLPVFFHAFESQRMLLIEGGTFLPLTYPLNELWVLANPDGFGNPARETWSWVFNYLMVASTYVGLLPLALLITALVAGDKRDRLFAGAAVLLFLMAMNWTPIGKALNFVFSFTANDRIRFIVVFLVAVAAARLLDRSSPRIWMAAAVSSALVGAVAGYVYIERVGRTVPAGSVIALAGLLVVWLTYRFRRPLVPVVACVATLLELTYFNWPFNAMNPREYYRPSLEIVNRIHAEAPDQPFRIVGHDWVFLPNSSVQYGLEDIRGSDPMAWREYLDFFRTIQVPEQSLDVGRVQDIANPLIGFLNVRYLMAEPDAHFGEPYRLMYRGPEGTLYRHEAAADRFFTPESLVARTNEPLGRQLSTIPDFRQKVVVEGSSGANRMLQSKWIRQTAPGRFRLTLEATGPTFIASSQPALPGTTVTVNGRATRIQRVNGAFIGFFVPAGKSRVLVEYVPAHYGLAILASILMMVFLILWGLRRRFRKGVP